MINEYFRPASVDETLKLLMDGDKTLKPLGGGTSVSRHQSDTFGVVDLQSAGLDQVNVRKQQIEIGATVHLSQMLGVPEVHPEIKKAIKIDASENIRNAATLGGWLVSGTGRSIFSTVLLAVDATLTWEPDSTQIKIGDWLPLRGHQSPGVLMTKATWMLQPHLVLEYVARSPKDQPILIVALAKWPSGRTRVALGGYGDAPIIAMDGPEPSGVDVSSRDAYFEAEDQWATAAYRREVAAKLALRCLARLDEIKEREA